MDSAFMAALNNLSTLFLAPSEKRVITPFTMNDCNRSKALGGDQRFLRSERKEENDREGRIGQNPRPSGSLPGDSEGLLAWEES
jgi:hypothetical protein